MQSCRHPLPLHVTWSLHLSSVDAVVDVHRRSHSFLLIHPQGSLPGLTLGVCQTTIFLWHNLTVTPPGSRLNWVGLVHLSHAWWTPKQRECQFLMQQGEAGCSVGHITVCIGPSLHTRGCLSWSDTPPHEAHPITCLLSYSFPERHQPSLRQDHQASDPWHLSLSHSTISIFGLLLLTGPELPRGQPSIGHGQLPHIHPHTWQRCLSWEVKVNWEPWPVSKH